MGAWEGLLYGFSVALSPTNLGACALGAVVGTLVGVLPGIGPAGAMAVLLPVTFGIDPTTALVMLAGIYYGSMYGGSTTSILVRVPGEAASVVTALDGYPMARQGRAGPALAIAAIGSWVAGSLGVLGLMCLAPPLARAAVRFGPPEYFALSLLGLVVLSRLTGGSPAKSYAMAALGVLLATIGMDPIGGLPRFVPVSMPALANGLNFIPVVMGLYGVSEVLKTSEEFLAGSRKATQLGAVPTLRQLLPSKQDFRRSAGPIARGSVLGFLFGLIPGPANIISTYASYALEKRISRRPGEFGKGAIEGVAGPESANNAATAGQLVPLLALGVPFSAITGLLLGGIMLHGIIPGPTFISEQPALFWGLVASMYLGNAMLLVLNLPMVGLFARLSLMPPCTIMPIVLLACLVGAYAINTSLTDVWVLAISGWLGYLLEKGGYNPAPLVLGLILGPMLEGSMRQTGLLLDGNWLNVFTRPVAAAFIVLAMLAMVGPAIRKEAQKLLARSRRVGAGSGRSSCKAVPEGEVHPMVRHRCTSSTSAGVAIGLAVMACGFGVASVGLSFGTRIYPGPAVVPFASGLALAVCSGVVLVKDRGCEGEPLPRAGALRAVLVVGTLLLFSPLALQLIGFPITASAMVWGCGRVLGQGTARATALALVAAGVAYLLFGVILEVPLPLGFGIR